MKILKMSENIISDFEKTISNLEECGKTMMTAEAFAFLVENGYICNHHDNRNPVFSPWKISNDSGYTYSMVKESIIYEETNDKDNFEGLLDSIYFETAVVDGKVTMAIWEGNHRKDFVHKVITNGFPNLNMKYMADSEYKPIAYALSNFRDGKTEDTDAINAFEIFKKTPIKFVKSKVDPNIQNGKNDGVIYKLREKVYNLLNATPVYKYIYDYYKNKEGGYSSLKGMSIGINPRDKKYRRQEVRSYVNNLLWIFANLCGFHLDKNGTMDKNAAIFVGFNFKDEVYNGIAPKICSIYDRFCNIMNTEQYDFLFNDNGINEKTTKKHRIVHEGRSLDVSRYQAVVGCASIICGRDRFVNDSDSRYADMFSTNSTIDKNRAEFSVSFAEKVLDFLEENGKNLEIAFDRTIANTSLVTSGVGHAETNYTFGLAMAENMGWEDN